MERKFENAKLTSEQRIGFLENIQTEIAEAFDMIEQLLGAKRHAQALAAAKENCLDPMRKLLSVDYCDDSSVGHITLDDIVSELITELECEQDERDDSAVRQFYYECTLRPAVYGTMPTQYGAWRLIERGTREAYKLSDAVAVRIPMGDSKWGVVAFDQRLPHSVRESFDLKELGLRMKFQTTDELIEPGHIDASELIPVSEYNR